MRNLLPNGRKIAIRERISFQKGVKMKVTKDKEKNLKIIIPEKNKFLTLTVEYEDGMTAVYSMFDRAEIDRSNDSLILINCGKSYRRVVGRIHFCHNDKLTFYDTDYISVTR